MLGVSSVHTIQSPLNEFQLFIDKTISWLYDEWQAHYLLFEFPVTWFNHDDCVLCQSFTFVYWKFTGFLDSFHFKIENFLITCSQHLKYSKRMSTTFNLNNAWIITKILCRKFYSFIVMRIKTSLNFQMGHKLVENFFHADKLNLITSNKYLSPIFRILF